MHGVPEGDHRQVSLWMVGGRDVAYLFTEPMQLFLHLWGTLSINDKDVHHIISQQLENKSTSELHNDGKNVQYITEQ